LEDQLILYQHEHSMIDYDSRYDGSVIYVKKAGSPPIVWNLALSEHSIAEILADIFADHFLVTYNVKGEPTWWMYDGKVWKRGGKECAQHECIRLCKHIYRITKTHIDNSRDAEGNPTASPVTTATMEYFKRRRTIHFAKSVVSHMSTLPCFRAEEKDFDNQPLLLNCQNGTIELHLDGTYKFRDHNPADRLTRIIPIKYRPKQISSYWEPALAAMLVTKDQNPCEDYVRFVRRFGGFLLSARESEEELVTFLLGGGDNGKNVFLETLNFVLGDFCRTVDLNSLMGKGDKPLEQRATLVGSRLAIATEGETLWTLDRGKFKALCDSTTTVRPMYGEHRDADIDWKTVIAANRLPNVTDTSHGFWRRVVVMPFYKCFTNHADRIPDLKRKLRCKKEGSAVLNWLLKGWEDYRKQGLYASSFPEPVTKEIEKWRAGESEGTLSYFLTLYTERDPDSTIPADTLYHNFKHWSDYKSLSRKGFSKQMDSEGFEKKKISTDKGRYHWAGLRFNAAFAEDRLKMMSYQS
jgi:P4 family phage/plasmid primase-like protien